MKKIRGCFFVIILLAYAWEGLAQRSLFFAPEELTGTQPLESQAHELTLGAISFLDPEDWTIWINEQPFKPQSPPPGLDVVAVEPLRIFFKWTGDDRVHAWAVGQTLIR